MGLRSSPGKIEIDKITLFRYFFKRIFPIELPLDRFIFHQSKEDVIAMLEN